VLDALVLLAIMLAWGGWTLLLKLRWLGPPSSGGPKQHDAPGRKRDPPRILPGGPAVVQANLEGFLCISRPSSWGIRLGLRWLWWMGRSNPS
jgi:hypothetical protein